MWSANPDRTDRKMFLQTRLPKSDDPPVTQTNTNTKHSALK